MATTTIHSASAGGHTQAAEPSFRAGKKRLLYMPGQLILRFHDQAAPAITLASFRSGARATSARAGSAPESVMALLKHMRDNLGLKDIVPLFTPTPVEGAPRPGRAAATAAPTSGQDGLEGYGVVTVKSKDIPDDLLRTMQQDKAIDLVERMPARWLSASAPDPQLNYQWGLRAIRWFQAKRPSASRISVAILDTGVDMNHPDLKGAVSVYQHFGFSGEDIIGHGTHVAGIIGALVNNGVGVAGVADCAMKVWKIFGDKPYQGDYYVDGTVYLQALYQVLQSDARVLNLSIGGGGSSKTEANLFNRLHKRGVFVAAAMGNEYQDGNPTSYPAAYKGVYAIGATDETGRRAPFSNTGRHIFISAPGTNILSTLPLKSSPARDETGYAAWSGTSMATPHVAGAAALIQARNPGFSPRDVAGKLETTAAKLKPMGKKSFTWEFGYGLINLQSALI